MADRLKTPKEYRERAVECKRLATDMVSPTAREIMLFVARRWRALADEGDGPTSTASNTTAPNPHSDP
jgi:hypothetical protein